MDIPLNYALNYMYIWRFNTKDVEGNVHCSSTAEARPPEPLEPPLIPLACTLYSIVIPIVSSGDGRTVTGSVTRRCHAP